MIRKGVVQHDARLLTRVLRQLTAVRAKLTPPVLRALTNQYMPSLTDAIVQAQVRHTHAGGEARAKRHGLPWTATPSAQLVAVLCRVRVGCVLIERASVGVVSPLLQGSMMTDSSDDAEDLSPPKPVADDEKKSTGTAKQNQEQAEKERKEAEVLQAEVPEVDVYIQLLVALFLFDRGLKEEVTRTARHLNRGAPETRCCGSSALTSCCHLLRRVALHSILQSVSLLSTLFTSLSTFNRRSLDPLSAKIYSFYALVCESTGKDAEIRKSVIHRGACL
jgi:hypothetical protein